MEVSKSNTMRSSGHPSRNSVLLFIPSLVMTSFGLMLALLYSAEYVEEKATYAILSSMLLVYLWLEISQLRRLHQRLWLINPIVLCSTITFVLGYGVTNVLFFLPESSLQSTELIPEVTPVMVKMMWLVSVGAVAMWLGYWSSIADNLSSLKSINRINTKFLPKYNKLKLFAFPALLLLSIAARIIQIELGVFGYSGTYERNVELASITEYLTYTVSLGKLALILSCLQYYKDETDPRAKKWFYLLLFVEVFFGFISGFKSAAFLPFFLVLVCQYLCRGNISKYLIILAIASIILSYSVVEQFRDSRNNNSEFNGGSFSNLTSEIIVAAQNSSKEEVIERAPLLLAIASRLNLSYMGSFAIDYADKNVPLPFGSPEFLNNILLAPLHAWIPRFVWEDKPLGNLGLWYNQVVMGRSHFSQEAMGPISYFYFSGGYLAVFIGFFLIGIIQRSFFFLMQPGISIPGSVFFLVFLKTLTAIDSSINVSIINLCREVPLLLIMLLFIFKRVNQKN